MLAEKANLKIERPTLEPHETKTNLTNYQILPNFRANIKGASSVKHAEKCPE
jgi:hypothetical protein